MSFIERLSFFFLGSQCTKTIGHVIFGTSNNVLCREVIIQCPYFGAGPLSDQSSTVVPS